MFSIMGRYKRTVEEIDTTDSHKEAYELLREYKIAFGIDWTLWIKET